MRYYRGLYKGASSYVPQAAEQNMLITHCVGVPTFQMPLNAPRVDLVILRTLQQSVHYDGRGLCNGVLRGIGAPRT